MGHCIQAIVTQDRVAEAICAAYPQLKRLQVTQQMSLIPIDTNFIAEVTGDCPPQETEMFMLLTPEFEQFLSNLSRFGILAYIETEYFGGDGGQGACVFANGGIVMPPTWAEIGVINNALKMLGVQQGPMNDCFDAIDLGRFRDNDDLIREAEHPSANPSNRGDV